MYEDINSVGVVGTVECQLKTVRERLEGNGTRLACLSTLKRSMGVTSLSLNQASKGSTSTAFRRLLHDH